MELHVRVLWRLTFQSFIDGRTGAYPRKCQTATASPAKPGELPFWLASTAPSLDLLVGHLDTKAAYGAKDKRTQARPLFCRHNPELLANVLRDKHLEWNLRHNNFG
jgi:hypothetical protein